MRCASRKIRVERSFYIQSICNEARPYGLPDYKPASVPRWGRLEPARRGGLKPTTTKVAVIPLGRSLLNGSSNLPGSRAGRAAPPPLFGLAPRGVFPASRITPAAVRSYRTFSPLPCFQGGIF